MATNEIMPQFEVIELHAPEPDARVTFRHQMVKINGYPRRSLEQVLSVEPPMTEEEVEALDSWEVQSGSITADVVTNKNGENVVRPPSNSPEIVIGFTKWLLGQRGGEYATVHDSVNTFSPKGAVVYKTPSDSADKGKAGNTFDVVQLGQACDGEPAVSVYDIPEGTLNEVYGTFAPQKTRRVVSVEPPITEEELHVLCGQRSFIECQAADPFGWAVPEKYSNSSEVFALELLKKIMILRNAQAGSLAVQDGDRLTRSLVKVIGESDKSGDKSSSNESQTRLSERLISLNRVIVNEQVLRSKKAAANAHAEL